ncbi:hypothetical protein HHL16_09100 [Pseudoflavitalea sp. G-6-1-2]|uniref:hypothetical protein n=1 Tax=Pseudoflavitalea sp. G-6-1-2 TaxID=2728841 RepID=UPI00146D258F|nr:hypothetical protein [Pseudoflavitalea sp. G-6-1-2]NML21028.1 hypothetical protein [Pseudoflavitalea sp. G-6-1-2]
MKKPMTVTVICIRIFTIYLASLLFSCENINTGPGGPPLPDEKPLPQPVSASVTISLNGKTLVSYECRSPNAVIDTDRLMIELNSTDTRHAFMGYVGNNHSGNYPLSENQQQGKATISIYSAPGRPADSIPAHLTPTAGALQLSALNGKTCSGTFSGTLKDVKGRNYAINGQFTNIPVRAIGEGK